MTSFSHILRRVKTSFNRQNAYVYCPRCDKPITPGHRCLGRRHFFGMLAGAAAVVAAPGPRVLPADVINAQLYRIPVQLYQGGAFRRYSPDGGDLGIGSMPTISWSIR